MMIRPKGDQLEISFSPSSTETWDGLVQNLNTFLSRKMPPGLLSVQLTGFRSFLSVCLTDCFCLGTAYNDSYQVQTNDNCPPDQYFIQEDSGEVKLIAHPPNPVTEVDAFS